MRSGVLLCALVGLAAVAARISRALDKIADERERRSGVLLRKHAVGPFRRWAIWIATLAAACVGSYLFNEHRPGVLTGADFLPARALDAAVVACGIGLVAPYIRDLAAATPTRKWLWSRVARPKRDIRDDDDVIGAIGRMSPPLVLAIGLAFSMLLATVIVGDYEPGKLLGGLGVLGLFTAGLLAAPALLRAQGAAIEPAWIRDWYPAQRRFMEKLRPVVRRAHQAVVVAHVSFVGVGIGALTTGSDYVSVMGVRLIAIGLVVTTCGFVLARLLWMWAERPSDEAPICTDELASRERSLTIFAGWALAFGSVCSLVAVLAG